jgi:hypothetical protein
MYSSTTSIHFEKIMRHCKGLSSLLDCYTCWDIPWSDRMHFHSMDSSKTSIHFEKSMRNTKEIFSVLYCYTRWDMPWSDFWKVSRAYIYNVEIKFFENLFFLYFWGSFAFFFNVAFHIDLFILYEIILI